MWNASERDGRTFLQLLEECDIQEVIFAFGMISPIGRPPLPLASLLSASRFRVAITGRLGGPAG